MQPLTKRQQQVYRVILKHCQKYGTGPTVRQLMETLDIGSPNGIVNHLKALVKKGWLARQGFGKRASLRPTCSYTVSAVKGKA